MDRAPPNLEVPPPPPITDRDQTVGGSETRQYHNFDLESGLVRAGISTELLLEVSSMASCAAELGADASNSATNRARDTVTSVFVATQQARNNNRIRNSIEGQRPTAIP
ncbi:hypothetical protein Acr_00g0103730 [Actinidia rufa]|uniref:Uncharacterized protein n=1 Tax=Actinidia rufa TaxID=165716 RepID=A0A7J0E117_9ERIC|nr:hypothetical protein Acr_00g0103730 [Actinidia rufa]